MKFESLLIITYGRSGSTLLTGILNSIDRCLIRGENNNFIEGFYDAYTKIESARQVRIGDRTTQAWYGIQDVDTEFFLESTKNTIKKLLFGRELYSDFDTYGFKEIRYFEMDNNKLSGYLNFLKKVFPKPCFVFNRRNHDEVCKSSWFADRNDETIKRKFVLFESTCDEFIANNLDSSIAVNYNKIIDLSSGELKNLFDFIEQPYNKEKIESILNIQHSYDNKSTHLPENSNVKYLLQLDENSVIYYKLNKLQKYDSIDRLEGSFLTADSKKLEKIHLKLADGTIVNAKIDLASPLIAKRFPNREKAKYCRYKITLADNINLDNASIIATIDKEEIPFASLSF
jgi:hypothetical protein